MEHMLSGTLHVNLITTICGQPLSEFARDLKLGVSFVKPDETHTTHDLLVLDKLIQNGCSSVCTETSSIFDSLIVDDYKNLTSKHLCDIAGQVWN